MLLSTENLILSEFKPSDWRDLLSMYNDDRHLRYLAVERRSETDIHALLKTYQDWQNEQPRRCFHLAVTLKKDGRFAGSVEICKRQGSGGRIADLTFETVPDLCNRGYATEAARCLMGFAFGELRLHRIQAACVAANQAAVRVLEKVGMRLEGRLRHNEWLRGQWHDTVIYGILELEFPDRLRQAGSIWT